MAHKIKKIKQRLDDIIVDKNKYNLTVQHVHKEDSFNLSSTETHSFMGTTTNLIGRENDEEKIKRLMLQTDGEKVSIIPIVGFGGLGKTTIAKSIYNDERLEFSLRIWVCVSDDFDLKKLIIKIIKSVTSEHRSYLDVDQLQKDLRGILDGKKYLLVLDDVWNEDTGKWLELKTLLMGGATGSKIIVTTRSNEVTSIMGTVPSQTLQVLHESDSWEFFVKFAFKEREEKDLILVEIGKEIVSKCKGVPLAIKTLGSLLHSKRNPRDWESIRDYKIWKLKQKENDILPALRLSYQRLPSYLQRCFAYCSMFPKDYEFNNFELVTFWMAQGLIQPFREDQELEYVGSCYLKELQSKCFFQDVEELPGGYLRFKMHDLVHDLALSVMQNECLSINSDSQVTSELKSVRHLTFLDSESVALHLSALHCNWDRVRSLLFHCELENKKSNLAIIHICLLRVPYLRYLSLVNCQLETLPKEIGRLKHLRFLSLAGNCKIRELPNSICKLQSLETLILGGCEEIEELPGDMRYMIKLRRLVITTKQRVLPKNGIGQLKSLRSLSIYKCENLEYLFDDMEELKCLRMLEINGCSKLICLPQSMSCLTTLETLFIRNCENLNQLPECLQNLTSLKELRIQDNVPKIKLSERCKRKIGVDWPKIARIPKIFVDNDGDGEEINID